MNSLSHGGGRVGWSKEVSSTTTSSKEGFALKPRVRLIGLIIFVCSYIVSVPQISKYSINKKGSKKAAE